MSKGCHCADTGRFDSVALNGLDLERRCQSNRAKIHTLVTTGYSENLSSVLAPVLCKPYDIDALPTLYQPQRG